MRSNLDLHCLHGYLFWSAEVKGLTKSLKHEKQVKVT